jgi:hypothetical protein
MHCCELRGKITADHLKLGGYLSVLLVELGTEVRVVRGTKFS